MRQISTLFFCLFFVKLLTATPKKPTLFEYFQSSEAIEVRIESNMRTLIKKKYSPDWIPGKLSWTNKDGISEGWDIEIRTRGKMRKEICYFPPLKIKFQKSDKKEIGVRGSRRMKLVSSCRGSNLMEQYVVREYMIYKFFNRITPESFRVQLVKFTFVNTGGDRDERTTYGFFIEDIEDVAKRLNAQELEHKIINPDGIQPASMDRMTVFQYAMGNTDWYIYNRHNLKLVKDNETGAIKVIPYDFDYAGLTDTGYSAPGEGMPIASVRQRIYIGACRSDEEWEETLKPYREAKSDWLKMVEEETSLNPRSKKSMLKYLDKFFCILENEKKTKRKMKKHCDKLIKRNHY